MQIVGTCSNRSANRKLFQLMALIVATALMTITLSWPIHEHLLAVRGEIHEARMLPLADGYIVPANVYYIWCGQTTHFEFRHHLGMLSILRYIRPDNIFFIYGRELPKEDNNHYYRWFSELSSTFPFLHTQQIPAACKNNRPDPAFVSSHLRSKGGIFVDERVVLNGFNTTYMRYAAVVGASPSGETLVRVSAVAPSNSNQSAQVTFNCVTTSTFNANYSRQPCVVQEAKIFPNNIMDIDTRVGMLYRKLMYGTTGVQRAVPNYNELVPNIAHVMWVGGGQMNFLFYIGVLSLEHVARVDTVYIHVDQPLNGLYWNLLMNNSRHVSVVRRTVGNVFGKSASRTLLSDALRAEIMVKYGGIYMDVDAIFVRPLTRKIRGYDAVGTLDITNDGVYPDRLNLGVSLGKRNAPFWRLFHESLYPFHTERMFYNGLEKPYKIYEKNPRLLRIDPRLQVQCYRLKCHPTWTPGFTNLALNHLTTGSINKTNWRHEAFAYHWTTPTPTELTSHTALMSSNRTLFAEMGLYVLEKAGMTEHFRTFHK